VAAVAWGLSPIGHSAHCIWSCSLVLAFVPVSDLSFVDLLLMSDHIPQSEVRTEESGMAK